MEVVTTYEPYSEEPEYIGANKALLETLELGSVKRVLDLACGTGLLSGLLLEMCRGQSVIINGRDISTESLDIGRRLFRGKGLLAKDAAALDAAARGKKSAILMEEGSAMDLDFPDATFDVAMIGNAIHLMPDKDQFVRGVQRVLKPGGQFVFNSVFYTGTFAPGSEAVYAEWMKEAVVILGKMNEERRRSGQAPIPRVRGRSGHAFDKDWRTPEQWSELLERNGFEVTRVFNRPIPLTQRALELVGAYGGLAEVLMSGYPVDIASECLQRAVGPAFERSGVKEITRYWLEVTSRKA